MNRVDQIANRIRSQFNDLPISEHEASKIRGVGMWTLSMLKDMDLVRRNDAEELSARAKNILHNLCLETKEQTFDALKSGKLMVGKTRCYGHGTHKEICDWLGISAS